MKKTILIMIIVCSAMGVMAQSRHTSRTADPAAPQHQERRDDHHMEQRNPRAQQPLWVASPEQVMLMIEQINKISFAQEKVDFAIFCVKLLPIPAEGMMRLAATMQYDNSKLEFLKQAFRYCPDTYNYMIVEQVFSFQASTDELRRYIEKEYNFKYTH